MVTSFFFGFDDVSMTTRHASKGISVCARACSPSSEKIDMCIYKAAMGVCTIGSVDTRHNYGASLSHTRFLYHSISQREGGGGGVLYVMEGNNPY